MVKPNIGFNTQKGIERWKNTIFGKTMENLRNRESTQN